MISGMFNAISALTAFGRKMEGIADHVSNAATEGFRKSRARLEDAQPGGVRVTLSRVPDPGTPAAKATTEGAEKPHPSEVSLEQEIPQCLLTEKRFAANIEVIRTVDDMIGSVLDITE